MSKWQDGTDLFYFVFQKGGSKDGLDHVMAYDQIRHLKNKDTYVYNDKTASQFLENGGNRLWVDPWNC